jgi:hypothetical protein
MARNIVVLIGSVTSKQYQPIRVEMLRREIKPEIHRLQIQDIFPNYNYDSVARSFGMDLLEEAPQLAPENIMLENISYFIDNKAELISKFVCRKRYALGVDIDDVAFVAMDFNEVDHDNLIINALEHMWGRAVLDVSDPEALWGSIRGEMNVMDSLLNYKSEIPGVNFIKSWK